MTERAAGDDKKVKPSAQVRIDRALFLQTLQTGLEKINLALAPQQQQQLADYYELLVLANQQMNLTAITAAAEVAEKHMIDSLLLASYINKEEKIVDVGSGAGLPGLPLAIAKPGSTFVLMDTLQKRCKFLQATVEQLGLANVTVVWGRAEDLAHLPEHREQYDWAVARAVAPLPLLLEYLLPLVKPKGHAVAMKSIKAEAELAQSKRALAILRGELEQRQQYQLQTGEARSLLLVAKIGPCAAAYPRNPGLIKKNPL